VSTLTGWRAGQLIFIDARLDDVVASLSRWYDLEFVLAPPRLAERHVSATFDAKHLTAEDLNFLSTSLGVRHSRTGRTITLSPQTP
jgi:ferric-dicitrate binding protein FerR (iron transport regulator)